MGPFAADRILAKVLLLAFAIMGCSPTSGEALLPKHALRRLGTLDFVSNDGGSTLVVYSPDGRYLAPAGFGILGASPEGVEIWELESGKNVTPKQLRGHDATGFSGAPEGPRFVTFNNNVREITNNTVILNGLYLWKVGDNNFQRIGDSKGPFHCVKPGRSGCA
jgi:WD40 repeat protein